jgi:hypothetical protein
MNSKLQIAVFSILILLTSICHAQTKTTCHMSGDDVECTSTDMTPAPNSDYRQGPYGPVYDGTKAAANAYQNAYQAGQQAAAQRQAAWVAQYGQDTPEDLAYDAAQCAKGHLMPTCRPSTSVVSTSVVSDPPLVISRCPAGTTLKKWKGTTPICKSSKSSGKVLDSAYASCYPNGANGANSRLSDAACKEWDNRK